jgi:hypothetical protein
VGDTDPPFVVSVSPEDGAIGVRADTDIVITFNEPMDRGEAEKGYESVELPPSAVTFSWSMGGRVLTVHPNEPLLYGTPMAGGTSAEPPKIYGIAMTTVARDEAGNRMAAEKAFSFQTLRKIQRQLAVPAIRRVVLSPSGVSFAPIACDGNVDDFIGDGEGNLGFGLLATFSTTVSPAYELPEDLLSATFAFSGDPPLTGFGALHAFRVRVPVLPDDAEWAMTGEEELTLTSTSTGTSTNAWSADVRSGFVADLAERDDGSTQYYVRYELPTNDDNTEQAQQILCASVRVTLGYLTR